MLCALSAGQLGCPGNTKQISGCQGNDQCPSGQICRPSDGQCVPPPTYAELTIVKSGDGSGRVASMPAGIDCGTTCTANVEVGAKLTLVATPSPDSQVLSFSIGCSSMATTCELTPTSSEPIRVLVNFSLTGAPPPPALQNAAGFYWENPRPVGNRLNDAVVSAGELWAVGDAGTILRRTGGAFTLVASGTNRNLNSIWDNAGELYTVGDGGTILRRGGSGFASEPSSVPNDLKDVWGSGGTVIAVGGGGTILRRGATSWSADTSNTGANLGAVFGNSATDIWAVGTSGTAVHYTSGAWSVSQPAAFGSNVLRALAGKNGTLYAADSFGGIYAYTSNWAQIRLVPSDVLYGLANIGGTIYGAGSNATSGIVLRYDGANWQPELTIPIGLRAIAGSATNDLWAVGESGTIWHSDGTPWQQSSTGRAVAMNSVWATDSQNVWAVGDNGSVLRYTGSYFKAVSVGTSLILNGVWAASATDVWVVGTGGLILHYDGNSWIKQQSGTDRTLRAVFGLSANRVFAVGDDGIAVTWNGTNWTVMPTSSSASLHTVWAASATDVWAAGETGKVLHSNNGAAFTDPVAAPTTIATLEGLWGTGVNDFWVTADTALFHYKNGSWSSATPSPGVSGLHGIWGSSASDLYATGQAGALLHYDGGVWSAVPTGAASDLLAVVASQRKLWVAGKSGTILRRDL